MKITTRPPVPPSKFERMARYYQLSFIGLEETLEQMHISAVLEDPVDVDLINHISGMRLAMYNTTQKVENLWAEDQS